MSRRARTFAALLAIVAMLFAPLAMALHACHSAQMEGMAHLSLPAADADAAADDDAVLPLPMDEVLCERHCHPSKLSVQPAGNPPSSPEMSAIAPLRVQPLEPVSLRAPAFDSPYAPAAGPAPPLIGFTVLRI